MITRIFAVIVTVIVAIAVAIGVFSGRTFLADRQAQKIAKTPFSSAVMQAPAYTVGLVSNNLPAFDQSCGCAPNVSVKYIAIGATAPSPVLPHQMLLNYATPLIELEPVSTPLSGIIAGEEDTWLTAYARMIKTEKAVIYMSFAPEANGYWYKWGWPNVQPATEVAAWRHVVAVFHNAGVTNVKWMWIVNTLWNKSGPLPLLWPGAAYVNEVGIDGYFRTAADTFDSVFAPTIKQLRQITTKPLLISETAASTQAGQTRAVAALTEGIAQNKLSGFIWFDINQGTGKLGHDNWSLTDTPAALAEYESVVKKYERSAG
jgi:Glycosyl hydrolase family 26